MCQYLRMGGTYTGWRCQYTHWVEVSVPPYWCDHQVDVSVPTYGWYIHRVEVSVHPLGGGVSTSVWVCGHQVEVSVPPYGWYIHMLEVSVPPYGCMSPGGCVSTSVLLVQTQDGGVSTPTGWRCQYLRMGVWTPGGCVSTSVWWCIHRVEVSVHHWVEVSVPPYWCVDTRWMCQYLRMAGTDTGWRCQYTHRMESVWVYVTRWMCQYLCMGGTDTGWRCQYLRIGVWTPGGCISTSVWVVHTQGGGVSTPTPQGTGLLWPGLCAGTGCPAGMGGGVLWVDPLRGHRHTTHTCLRGCCCV
jgi:hypothetical protein